MNAMRVIVRIARIACVALHAGISLLLLTIIMPEPVARYVVIAASSVMFVAPFAFLAGMITLGVRRQANLWQVSNLPERLVRVSVPVVAVVVGVLKPHFIPLCAIMGAIILALLYVDIRLGRHKRTIPTAFRHEDWAPRGGPLDGQ